MRASNRQTPHPAAEPQQKDGNFQQNTRKTGQLVHFTRGKRVPPSPLEQARIHVAALTRAFKAASPDEAQVIRQETEPALREVGIIGRPSGHSPPEPVFELPTPTVWWKKEKARYKADNKTPADFIKDHYSQFINKDDPAKGLSLASFAHPGQDRPLYDAIMYWLTKDGNHLPPDIAPYVLTPPQRNDQELDELDNCVTPQTVPDPRKRKRLRAAQEHRGFG